MRVLPERQQANLVSIKDTRFGAVGGADTSAAVLRPTSTITNTWAFINGGATAHEVVGEAVSKPDAPAGTGYVQTTTVGEIVEVKVPSVNLTSPKVAIAQVFADPSASGSIKIELRRGTTILTTQTVSHVESRWFSVPYAGVTQADVDDLRIRVEFMSGTYAVVYTAYVELVNDDTAAIVAAAQAAYTQGGGTVFVPRGTFGISDDIEMPDGVNLVGEGALATTFRCLNAAAGIRFGSGAVGGAFVNHDVSQGWHLDGDLVSTYGVKISSTGGMFVDIMVTDVNGDCLTVLGQNNSFHRVITSDANNCGLVLDNGTGGNTFYNCHFNAATEWGIELRETAAPTAGAYAVPQFNYFHGGICEGSGSPSFGTTGTGKGAVRQLAGAYNYFSDWNVYITNGTNSVGWKLQPNTVAGRSGDSNGRLYLRDCSWTGVAGAGQYGVWCDAVSGGVAGGMVADVAVVFQGSNLLASLTAMIKWGTNTPFFNEGLLEPFSTPVELVTDGTGAYAYVWSRLAPPTGWKTAALAATVGANITLSGTQTIDGVALVSGNRVLVKDQTTASANGIYVVRSGAWERATDFKASYQVFGGVQVVVSQGTAHQDTTWGLKTDDPIVLGTTSLVFARTNPPYVPGTPKYPFGTGTAHILENIPRYNATAATVQPTAATLQLVGGIVLQANRTYTNVNVYAIAAGATVTIKWFALIRMSDRVVLARSTNVTSVYSANAVNTYALSTPYLAPADIPIYIGIATASTTGGSLATTVAGQAALHLAAPFFVGNSTTVPTTTTPAVGTAVNAPTTGGTTVPYVFLT